MDPVLIFTLLAVGFIGALGFIVARTRYMDNQAKIVSADVITFIKGSYKAGDIVYGIAWGPEMYMRLDEHDSKIITMSAVDRCVYYRDPEEVITNVTLRKREILKNE